MKLSDLTPKDWQARLNARRQRQREDAFKWWQYVDLEQPLTYIARILQEQSDRFPPLLVAWPTLVLDSVDERLTIEGFRQSGADEVVEDLRRVWQVNDLDEGAPEGHYAALATKHSYILVGPGDDGDPLITIEYPDQMIVEIDPRTRQVVAGLKAYCSDVDSNLEDRMALYLPGEAYEFEPGKFEQGERTPYGAWGEVLRNDPHLPSVPIQPLLNRPRQGVGRSELVELKPIVDAANQTATNMMAAIEHHAVGRKWLLGASENDFVDEQGNKIPLWKVATGDVWAIPNQQPTNRDAQMPEVKVGQFAASDLRNFHESMKMLATMAASIYGLPPNYMGYTSDNPVSAEAIRYSLDRLIRRCERRQVSFGGAWERTMRIVWAMLDKDPTEISSLETVWRDPSTPTRAAVADAATKLLQIGAYDAEQVWNELHLTEGEKDGLRKRMRRQGVTAAQSLRDLDAIAPPEVPSAPVLRS